MEKKLLYFSLFSGQIYDVPEDEVKLLDGFQIPLIERPKDTCRKCYGRFYTAFNTTGGYYEVCASCARKYVDAKRLGLKKNDK